MSSQAIKKSLIEIANKVTHKTTIEDVYEQLALLSDIEKSEEQEKLGEVFSHAEVKKKAKKWLK